MDTIVFTPAALLEILSQIDELRDVNVGITQTIDGKFQLQVGESAYLIDSENAEEVSVDESAVEKVEDVNMDAYEELDNSGEVSVDIQDESEEPVESGILKEIAKGLLIRGIIKLAPHLLR